MVANLHDLFFKDCTVAGLHQASSLTQFCLGWGRLVPIFRAPTIETRRPHPDESSMVQP
jgi:hypothetical protein